MRTELRDVLNSFVTNEINWIVLSERISYGKNIEIVPPEDRQTILGVENVLREFRDGHVSERELQRIVSVFLQDKDEATTGQPES